MNERVFADLSPAEVHQVSTGILRAVDASFAVDRQRDSGKVTMTGDEIRRRFRICEAWFRTLRGEKQWTLRRTLSALVVALRTELDGGSYVPDDRTLWLPQDGT